jgi:hypothetical protein
MQIGRAIIIPVILALSVAGSILSGAQVSVAATHAASVHVQALPAAPALYHHG